MLLPEIGDKIIKRPGKYKGKANHFIPNSKQGEFWEAFYEVIASSGVLQFPLQGDTDKINPYFGNFGRRWHPVNRKPGYFHIGIDISGKVKTPIHPLADGILEYSGYGVVNGNYVFLMHPDIKTEDGYYLSSLYMHLRKIAVKFNPYQKMLREISFHTYPEIAISKDKRVGTLGSTGNALHPHLHLQLELRDKKGNIVAIDPAKALGLEPKKNISSVIKTKKDFKEFYGRRKKDIHHWKLEKLWN